MKIILLEDVDNLGHAGDTIETKDGYARNFLLPRRLAVLSTSGGLRFLEAKRKQAALKSEHEKKDAQEVAKKLESLTCTIKARVGQEGKLFGSVTTHDVHEELQKNRITIERKRIEMAPIHQLGNFHAKIKLHPEVEVSLKISVITA